MEKVLASAGAAARVTRIVAASESRIEGSVMEQLFAVRARFMAAEDSRDVHAAVLYSSGWFVIWIEGSEAGIEAVMRRSVRDSRHAHLRVIHRSKGPRQLGEKLTLASTQGADRPFDFARRIHAVERAGTALQAPAIWQVLSAPWTLADAGTAPVGRCCGIALVASDDNDSIDLLQRLAQRFSSPVVYQRFANGDQHSRDVGGAYIDLPVRTQSARVQVFSRRALGHRMVRESIERARGLALLLGPRPGPAIELAASVALAANMGASLPGIQLVAPGSEIADSVGQFLQKGSRRAMATQVVQLPRSQLVEFVATLADRECGG